MLKAFVELLKRTFFRAFLLDSGTYLPDISNFLFLSDNPIFVIKLTKFIEYSIRILYSSRL
ncbi:hypothetical protein D0500_10025 [Leuconostoc mesenteroides]|nr:hypothetical protein [Leuconostoc mesenteroides]